MNGHELKTAGYIYLIEKYGLKVIPPYHLSYVSDSSYSKKEFKDGSVVEVFSKKYLPDDTALSNLEFALKYDGVDLGVISAFFELAGRGDVTDYVLSKPTGKYARIIWFLFEFLTGDRLPVEDMVMGNYVPVLDEEKYFTAETGERVQRQRVINNLLGGKNFCPVVRKTENLKKYEDQAILERCLILSKAYPVSLLRRALSYLYTKETKSSFEIENVKQGAAKTESFIELLKSAEKKDFCEKISLVELQKKIVDLRFSNDGYRKSQNYVGQTAAYDKEIIHYVCPKPEDVKNLMEGLISANVKMKAGGVHALVHAAAVSYGFVFIHPFDDGNGRIHRFLIHNILSLRGAVPENLMFPVSAVMLKNMTEYDGSLEAFSKPLLKLIDYSLDSSGNMKVEGQTGRFYKYTDVTSQAEALGHFIDVTIDNELTRELDFLVHYDIVKAEMSEVVEMPDNKTDLFIRLCVQNVGTLSARKKADHFAFLKEKEVKKMQEIVKEHIDFLR
jgi:uncharacterized protein YggL (DUF469 family)